MELVAEPPLEPAPKKQAVVSDAPARTEPPPFPTALQQRLGQVFEHAKRSFEKGDWDYAHDLFTQCVAEAPGNVVYLQHFRANLTKRGGGKRGSALGVLRGKSAGVTKLIEKGQPQQAIEAGCKALKKNPADSATLREMAAACGSLGHAETQLHYLRWALDADPQSHETNRQAAEALAAVQEFDQAVACWQRILQQKPGDEEASKAVARLSVEKTIHRGGYDPQLLSGGGEAPEVSTARVADLAQRGDAAEPADDGREAVDPKQVEQSLVRAIEASRDNPDPYVALAEHYAATDREIEAERLLTKAVSLSDTPTPIREKLEDIQLRRVRVEVMRAQQRAAEASGASAKTAGEAYRRTLQRADQVELQVYTARAERKPTDPRGQFDLGVRLKRVGQHREAIKALQAARGDSQRAAETQLYLGECFQQIKQYKLAATSYEAAVEASAKNAAASDAAAELRKLALYRAGVLAMGLGDLDTAEERLTDLAGCDFAYRDVADRLDKIAAMRNDA
ncbi:MAG: hypothetical protein AAF596_01740 [Planctomycetota bacterium]